MKTLAILAALCAPPVFAETAMTFEEFEALVTGRSFDWALQNQAPYGIETYGSDRRVLWTIFGQDCKEGIYFEGPENQVCFDYPNEGIQQCWLFFSRDGALVGQALYGTEVDLTPSTNTATCIQDFLGT